MDAQTIVYCAIGAGVGLCLCGGLGGYVGDAKGRGMGEGFVLGFLLGPLGILIEALLPNQVRQSDQPVKGVYPGRADEAAGN